MNKVTLLGRLTGDPELRYAGELAIVENKAKQESKFLKSLAKDHEILVCGEKNGNHITYQLDEKLFLEEFRNNDFVNSKHDGDIVTDFYYKGNLVTNFKVFPGTFNTESETIYDVISYIMKQKYINENTVKEEIPKMVLDKNQLQGQMSIFDFIGR